MATKFTDRRGFLLGAAALAGAGCAANAFGTSSAFGAQTAQPVARKQIMVGGRAVRVVDIHGHLVIPASEQFLAGSNVKGDYPRAQIMPGDRFQRMDARGIDVQVISINQYWWYGADRELAAKIVRAHDEGVSAWCKEHSDRFVGLTSPAIQHPDLAAEQLDHAVKNLGLKGASIGGNIEGEIPSAEKYDPFWKKAEELQVPVFMHPTNAENIVIDGRFDGRGDLGNIVGNPMETTLFLSKLIFDGVFDRFPRLKVCGAHGGGFLPSYFGRTEVTCDVRANAKCANTKRPNEYLKNNIMADSMVFSDEGLRHLVAEMGAGQVVYGSDMPFNWPDTIPIVANASFLTNEQKEAILGGNLIRMLKI